jgi:hypothetical protein
MGSFTLNAQSACSNARSLRSDISAAMAGRFRVDPRYGLLIAVSLDVLAKNLFSRNVQFSCHVVGKGSSIFVSICYLEIIKQQNFVESQ